MRLAWELAWPFGGVTDVWGVGCGCCVVRVHENRKNPVNVDLQGVVLFPGVLCVA